MQNIISRESLIESLKKNKTWILFTAGIGSFISDICTPIAPFCKYILIAGTIISAILLLAYISIKTLRLRILPVLMFSVLISFISGVLFGLQGSNNNGFLSNTIPAINNIQKSLGLISEDVSTIKETTIAIKEDTKDIKTATQSIDTKMDVMIDKVGKQGGIISDPSSPRDFYHNARIYELNGDYAKARESYLNYFKSDNHKLDPHLRFQKFIKIEEGISGARELYKKMFSNSSDLIDQYATILLEDSNTRKRSLEDFEKKHKEFGPVFYDLAKLNIESEGTYQTLSDRIKINDYINKFLDAYNSGNLVKYYLDKEEIDNIYKEMNKDQKELLEFGTIDQSISATANINSNLQDDNEEITYFIGLRNNAIDYIAEYFYRIDGEGEFIGLGIINENQINPVSQKPFPNSQFKLSQEKLPKKYIEVKYVDTKGNEIGPFKIDWFEKLTNGKTIDLATKRAIGECNDYLDTRLNKLPNDYKSWGYDLDILNGFFSGSEYCRLGIEKVMYGLNKDNPDITLNIPHKAEGRYSNRFKLQIKEKPEKLSLKFIFKDGSEKNSNLKFE